MLQGKLLNVEYKGWVAMFGAFNIAMLVGQNYIWGALGEYIISFLHYTTDPGVTTAQAISVIPLTWLGLNIMSFVGPQIIKYINIRILLAFGAVVNLGSAWIGFKECSTFSCFKVWWGFVACLGSGLMMSATMVIVWEWFEERKGLGTGIYFCGFTTGAVICQNIGFKIVNPNDIGVAHTGDFFPEGVALNVPHTINVLFIVWIVFGIIGIVFLFRRTKVPRDAED